MILVNRPPGAPPPAPPTPTPLVWTEQNFDPLVTKAAHARGDAEAMTFEGVLRRPEQEALWLDENEARHPRSARQILAGLAALADPERYAACGCDEGRIVSGPVSSLLLTNAQAEIHFTFRITSYGYPDAW